MESTEDVKLVVDLSCAEHVEDLHHDKTGEDESHVAGRTGLILDLFVEKGTVPVIRSAGVNVGREDHVAILIFVLVLEVGVPVEVLLGLGDELISVEEEEEQAEGLPEGLTEDVLNHLTGHDVIVSVLRGSFEESWCGEFSGQSKGCKRVHDEVDPEELDGFKRGLFNNAGSDEGHDKSSNIDSELEHEETLDVVVDGTTPHGGLNDGGKVVVKDLDIAGFLGNIGSGDAHGEADVGLGERGGVIGSITSHSDDVFHLTETRYEEVLVFGAGSSNDLEVLGDLLELLEVHDLLLAVFLLALTVLVVLLAVSALEASNSLIEFLAFHADLLVSDLRLFNDAALDSDGHGSDQVVTGDHSDSDSGSLAGSHSLGDFLAHNIVDTENADQGESGLLDILDQFVFRVIMLLAAFSSGDILVGNGDGSKGLFGVRLDNVSDLTSHVIGEGLSVTLRVKVVRAAGGNDFRGSLDVDSLVVAAESNVLDDGGSTLSIRVEGESDEVY